MQILRRYLDKLKIKDATELTTAEKATYDKWVEVFSKEVTVKDVITFLKSEIERLRVAREQDTRSELDESYRLRILNYKSLLAVVEKPEREKRQLEAAIESIIKSK